MFITDGPLVVKAESQVDNYLQELRALGDRFEQIELTRAQCVELETWGAVVAQAGDLEIEHGDGFQRLTPREVVDALHRQPRFRAHPVLRAAWAEAPGDEARAPVDARPAIADDR